jgi:DNA integrity scanning protein DisA with diadenylate cyclase activity
MGKTFEKLCERATTAAELRAVLETVVELAVEIAREGREGRKIGTLFVVGDCHEVLERSRPLILDPLYGHREDLLQLDRADFRETVKELAQLDGAFVVRSDGTFLSAGRYIDVDLGVTDGFVSGLGTRHAAAASITAATDAVAVVVSQSSVVRVYAHGRVKAEIIPELFLMSRGRLFADRADVQHVPEAGITVAVADADDARASAAASG